MTTKITFWQNSLSIHQAPLIREVAANSNMDVCVVVEKGVSPERLSLGWTIPDYGRSAVFVAPNPELMKDLLAARRGDQAHILSGIGVYAMVETARRALMNDSSGKLLVQTESLDRRGLPRSVRYRMRAQSLAAQAREFDTVLACGSTGMAQWQSCVGENGNVREFGYFVGGQTQSHEVVSTSATEATLVFVGALEPWKSPELILKALTQIGGFNWRAIFVGRGSLEAPLRRFAARTGIEDRVDFLGVLENAKARRVIGGSDVLVLPSAYDGWGAVVNEALTQGVPAIVSRNAGASTLIRGSLQGETFTSGDSSELAESLVRVLKDPRTPKDRRELASWAEESISPGAGAHYLMRLIQTDCDSVISPPWA